MSNEPGKRPETQVHAQGRVDDFVSCPNIDIGLVKGKDAAVWLQIYKIRLGFFYMRGDTGPYINGIVHYQLCDGWQYNFWRFAVTYRKVPNLKNS